MFNVVADRLEIPCVIVQIQIKQPVNLDQLRIYNIQRKIAITCFIIWDQIFQPFRIDTSYVVKT